MYCSISVTYQEGMSPIIEQFPHVSSDLLSSLWQQDPKEGVRDARPWWHAANLDQHQEANQQERNEGEPERAAVLHVL